MKNNKLDIAKDELLDIVKDKEFLELIVKEIKEYNHNFYASPLPNVKELKALEEIHPGITKEIIEMAKNIRNDNKQIEEKTLRVIEKDIDVSKTLASRGQKIALFFIIGMFAFSGIFMYVGQYTQAAFTLAAVAGTTVVSSLLNSKNSTKEIDI